MALPITHRRDGETKKVTVRIIEDTVINGIGHVFAERREKDKNGKEIPGGKIIREADIVPNVKHEDYLILKRFGRCELIPEEEAPVVPQPDTGPRRRKAA
ncbi:MAG TPA: hypothetical protein VG733_02620 [Chthoniobacteraceae bacterium]|nr:hypothetical protein [Chthoniobacteraceae bacterium]